MYVVWKAILGSITTWNGAAIIPGICIRFLNLICWWDLPGAAINYLYCRYTYWRIRYG